jgi:hypothetical protein
MMNLVISPRGLGIVQQCQVPCSQSMRMGSCRRTFQNRGGLHAPATALTRSCFVDASFIPATSARPESKLAVACALLSLSMTTRHEPSDSDTAEHRTLTQARLGTAERHEMQVENSNESLKKKL